MKKKVLELRKYDLFLLDTDQLYCVWVKGKDGCYAFPTYALAPENSKFLENDRDCIYIKKASLLFRLLNGLF